MNREPEVTVETAGHEGGLFVLAVLSLFAGGAAGLLGAVFRLSLDQADRCRDALIAWAHGEKLAGFLLVAATCTAAARGRGRCCTKSPATGPFSEYVVSWANGCAPSSPGRGFSSIRRCSSLSAQ